MIAVAIPLGIGPNKPPKSGVTATLKIVPKRLRSSDRTVLSGRGDSADENVATIPSVNELASSWAWFIPSYTAKLGPAFANNALRI